MSATRSVWQRALPSTVLILLCPFPLFLSSDLFKMLLFIFFIVLGDTGYFLMTQAPVAIPTEVKNNALFKYPVVTSRSYIYMNFPHKTPATSRKHHHNSQTSRKYYQVDNLQDIYKLTVTVSFTVAYEKICKNITKKNSKQLGPVDQKEFNRGHYTGLFKFGGVHWAK